jgi:modulator of FtsH protease HflK
LINIAFRNTFGIFIVFFFISCGVLNLIIKKMNRHQHQLDYYGWLIRKNLSRILIGLFALVLFFTSVRTIGPEEEGVVVQMGRYNRTLSPGLNFILPFGIEKMYKIPVQRQHKLEFGFRTQKASSPNRYSTKGYGIESMMLTGDLNLANVEWVVQYRIVDSYKYLFRVRNAVDALHDMSEAAMRKVVGDHTANEVLTVGRQQVATDVEVLLQRLCDEYENGIRIVQVVLQDVNPPDPVKPSFNAVNQAQQERETLINRAESEYNRVIPRARGEAQETIQRAEAYALSRVNVATGEAERFNELYSEFIKAPEVTKKRMYLETMGRILPNLGNKIIMDEKGTNLLPLFNIENNHKEVTK